MYVYRVDQRCSIWSDIFSDGPVVQVNGPLGVRTVCCTGLACDVDHSQQRKGLYTFDPKAMHHILVKVSKIFQSRTDIEQYQDASMFPPFRIEYALFYRPDQVPLHT